MTSDLFDTGTGNDQADSPASYRPLAARMRPANLAEYVGQSHLVGPGKPLRIAIEADNPHSMILWGPPGVGKTSLARVIAEQVRARFVSLSAVLSGVKDIRSAVEEARTFRSHGEQTILFVDEVHRFNKAQQDAFLPHVEEGTIIFIGATTENPSFELNNALLSRTRVYKLRSIENEDLENLIDKALEVLGEAENLTIKIDPDARKILIGFADGDARKLLNTIEVSASLVDEKGGSKTIDRATIDEALEGNTRRFDKQGEYFYEQISALHKSVRGSDPDASLYWFTRMLDGGCDPLYIARRVVRMASEDIGNADPRALRIALDAWDVQERLGSPEGELAIAQAVLYMAVAAKSNAVYKAFNSAKNYVQSNPSDDVPMHLRNAPTSLMKSTGYGDGYRYAHDEPHGYAAGEHYWPDGMTPENFYCPVDRGLEKQISEKLVFLRSLDRQADAGRESGNKPEALSQDDAGPEEL